MLLDPECGNFLVRLFVRVLQRKQPRHRVWRADKLKLRLTYKIVYDYAKFHYPLGRGQKVDRVSNAIYNLVRHDSEVRNVDLCLSNEI